MRQVSPVTNLVLAVLAGMGLLASLSMPWFAAPLPASADSEGGVERAAGQMSHFFGTQAEGRVSGTEILGGGHSVLVAIVVAVAVLAAAVAVPVLRKHAEELLRAVAVSGPPAVVILVAMHPGANAPGHVHYGALVSFAVAVLMATAGWHGASMRSKRRTAPKGLRISGS